MSVNTSMKSKNYVEAAAGKTFFLLSHLQTSIV